MEIIIAGAGAVGYRLARTLSSRHNVSIIDSNRDAIERIAESVDIMPIVGNAEDPDTYQAFVGKNVDLFIAVTDNDEVNLVSCLIVDESIHAKEKIIRLKNNFFSKSSITEKLRITEAVFPIMRTANSVKSLLHYPKANSVKSINESPFRLISIRVHVNSKIPVISAKEMESEQIRLIGIERQKQLFILKEETALMPGDLLYFYGNPDAMTDICSLIETHMPARIKNVVIFGADALGIEIARHLYEPGVTIKIVEHDLARCEYAASTLRQMATVINGRYGDHRLFEDEGLKNADMLIASGKNDADNIVKCLEAREHGIERVVAINNDTEYYTLMHNLNILPIRGVKSAAYYAIIEKISASSIAIDKHFCGGSGMVYVRTVHPDSQLIGKRITPLKQTGALCMIQRGSSLIPLHEHFDGLQSGDIIIVFCLIALDEKVTTWIHTL